MRLAAVRDAENQGLGVSPAGPYPGPVTLLERDDELATLRAALAGALDGQGSGVAVAGDAGTGKSTLLDAACAERQSDLRVLRGSCDPLRTPRPLGPFRDIARDAGLGSLMTGDDTMLAQVCEEIYEALRTEPTVLVVEDLHWVDAASIDVLRFLARRVDAMPLALLVSYRDHEVGPRHSARPLLGDIAQLDGMNRLQLRALSVAAVRDLVDHTGLDPLEVYALTGGNPFFVTEIAKEPDGPLPASIRDAVLARTADVTPDDFDVLQLVATSPDVLPDRVLPALRVDLPTLRRLDATGLLTRARGGLVFRHELGRQAVESTIPPGGGPRLHARLLEALEQVGIGEPAVLTHHAVEARDRDKAVRYATTAADDAIRAGAHSEAAAFLQTALDNLNGAIPVERAGLLLRLGFQQYMTSRLAEAIDTVSETFPLWQQAGDSAGLAAAYEACAVYEYYSARRRQAEAHADRAGTIAKEAGQELSYGIAQSTRGYLAYHRGDVDLALMCCAEADGIARRQEHAVLALRSELVTAVVALAEGEMEARARVVDCIEVALANGWDELASTGYSNVVHLDVEQRRFRAAERVLAQSIPFTIERDIPICRSWQTAVRSRLRFAQGHWGAALEDADQVLDGEGMPLARLWPILVRALIPLRTGAADDLEALFEAAWRLAEQLDEPRRRLALLSALAERMWLTDVPDTRVTDFAVSEIEALGSSPGSAWAVGELAVWLGRLGLLGTPPAQVAEPFRLAIEGRAEEAASWWRLAGEPFAEAMAWSDSADPVQRALAVELLDRLGAMATADRQRVILRRDGITKVPPRPRERTRANPAGLTNRQLDVAKLIARGFTNAEIAARLYISPKTADHHVSAILGKLGLPNRRAVVVRADELGLA